MPIQVISHKATKAIRTAADAGVTIIDVTSHGPEPWVKFSPFYPLGGIPVPLSPGRVTASVEGAWQGLKLFEQADVDLTKLSITTMKDLKRTIRVNGPIRGHRAGIGSATLLSYVEARKQIYLPLYRWVLDNRLGALVNDLRRLSEKGKLVLLDYETNGDVEDASRPLSHAQLIKRYLEGEWPTY